MNVKSVLQGDLLNGKNIVETVESLLPYGKRALKLVGLRPQRVVGAMAVLPGVALVGAGMVVGAGIVLALPPETTAKVRGSFLKLYRTYVGAPSASEIVSEDEPTAHAESSDEGTLDALEGQHDTKGHKPPKSASRDASYSARKAHGNHAS